MKPLGAHILMTAATVQLNAVIFGEAPVDVVRRFAGALRNSERIDIRAVRIIGTCALCGKQAAVIACTDCERDADKDCLVRRGRETLCLECAA